ncbi:MAG: ribosomal protein S18-alanine N-acetyltransferase [Candidatus Riflemargulisbacteria bacterium]
MIKLQKAQSKDVAFLVDLHKETIGSSWNEEDLCDAIQKSDKNVYLITEDDSSVGYIMVDVLSPEAEIINIAVMSEKQARKIGSFALDILMKELLVQGIESVFLEVRENSKAVNFYKNHNFEVIGLRRQYYSNGENALRMQRKLGDFQ